MNFTGELSHVQHTDKVELFNELSMSKEYLPTGYTRITFLTLRRTLIRIKQKDRRNLRGSKEPDKVTLQHLMYKKKAGVEL